MQIRAWDQAGSAELGQELGHGGTVTKFLTKFGGPCKSVRRIKRATPCWNGRVSDGKKRRTTGPATTPFRASQTRQAALTGDD